MADIPEFMSNADSGPPGPYPGAQLPTRSDLDGKREERVFKMFTSAEAVQVIKGEHAVVRIGSGPESREVVVRPLNPRQLLQAFTLINEIMLPLIDSFKPGESITFAQIVTVLGPKIEKVPELVHIILKRGNDISLDWINDNLDILLDLQVLLPIFMRQNGLDKLFAPKARKSAVQTSTAPTTSESTNEEQTAG